MSVAVFSVYFATTSPNQQIIIKQSHASEVERRHWRYYYRKLNRNKIRSINELEFRQPQIKQFAVCVREKCLLYTTHTMCRFSVDVLVVLFNKWIRNFCFYCRQSLLKSRLNYEISFLFDIDIQPNSLITMSDLVFSSNIWHLKRNYYENRNIYLCVVKKRYTA